MDIDSILKKIGRDAGIRRRSGEHPVQLSANRGARPVERKKGQIPLGSLKEDAAVYKLMFDADSVYTWIP